MSLYNQPIPNLIGGVSQQPPITRFLNQLGESINAVADPVEGLGKRAPLEHVKKLMGATFTQEPAGFFIDRDLTNRFVALVADGQARVFDIFTGQEKTVNNIDNAAAYLVCDNPETDIRSLTIADYTILLNRTKTTARGAATAASRPKEALVFVRAGNYGRTYSITLTKTVGGGLVVGSYSTPDGSSAAHTATISTSNIAGALVSSMSFTLTGQGYTVTQNGSLIYITHPTDDFTVKTEDGQGNEALRAYKDDTQRFADLPRTGIEGVVLRIAGDPTNSFDDYFVRFNGQVWEETVEPGVNTQWDPTTLPVALIRQPNGSFNLEKLPWVSRAVGNDDSNPFASFEGLKLSSMIYYRNRLGFLADENVILSKSGDFFNFFRTTLTQLLPDDPIDIAVGDVSGESSPVTKLEHGVAFDKKLALFAANGQFVLDADGGLTPGSAQVDPVTSFACSTSCRPVAAGRYIYFPFDRDGASGVREFFIEGVSQTEDAAEITAQCPTYLPARVVSMAATTLENTLLARSSDFPSRAYVYEFLWDGPNKLQSAWHQWQFRTSNSIRHFFFAENVAYFVLKRADGYHLERMRLRPNLFDPGLPYLTALDHRVTLDQCTVTYSGITQQTSIVLPYAPESGLKVFTRKSGTNIHAPGVEVPIVSTSGSTIVIAGDRRTWDLVIGYPYNFRIELSRPFFSPPDKIDPVANTETEIRLRSYSLDFVKSGYFKATFSPRFRGSWEKLFTGTVLGATAISGVDLDDGKFNIKTPTKNVHWNLTIENDSIFPSNIVAASWLGLIESKSQRVG